MNVRARKYPRLLAIGLMAALVLAMGAAVSPAVADSSNPYQRGPDPTEASITAISGPFALGAVPVVGGPAFGFSDGTVYYPTDTSEGTFGAVVIMPGYLATQSMISWLGPRLASQGFVVMTMDSDTIYDLPSQRAAEMIAALHYLTTVSPVKSLIDPTRLAVAGWSMGGGGTLEAEDDMPSLKAGVAYSPWDSTNPGTNDTTPTMIFGATGDTVAPVATYAGPFYNAITGTDKALVELTGGSHFIYTAPNTEVAEYTIAWMKRFVDNDTRYDQFLCPAPAGDPAITSLQITCPL